MWSPPPWALLGLHTQNLEANSFEANALLIDSWDLKLLVPPSSISLAYCLGISLLAALLAPIGIGPGTIRGFYPPLLDLEPWIWLCFGCWLLAFTILRLNYSVSESALESFLNSNSWSFWSQNFDSSFKMVWPAMPVKLPSFDSLILRISPLAPMLCWKKSACPICSLWRSNSRSKVSSKATCLDYFTWMAGPLLSIRSSLVYLWLVEWVWSASAAPSCLMFSFLTLFINK